MDYEFNAPQHYFDLNYNAGIADDTYFDCQDLSSDQSQLRTPQVSSTSNSKPLRSSSRHNTETPVRKDLAPSKIKTVATSSKMDVGSTPKRQENVNGTPAKPSVSVDCEDKENAHQATPPKSAKRGSISKKTKSLSPTGMRSSPRLAAIAKALRRSNAARRSAGSSTSQRFSSSNKASLSTVIKQTNQNNRSVPKVSGMRGLNGDDLTELAAITTFKKAIVKNKKKDSLANNRRLAPTVPHEFNFATDNRLGKKNVDPPAPARKHAPLKATRSGPTRPQEFNFATDTRIKKQPSMDQDEAKAFPQSLRSSSSASEKEMPKGPTIPQPFNLTETRKGGAPGTENKFVSVAELNLKFHTRTPQRFRSKRLGSTENLTQNKKQNAGVTIPVTPNLSTRTRSRPTNALPREELEMKEFEEAQKHKFKARQLNPPAEGSQLPNNSKGGAMFGGSIKNICEKLGCSSNDLASLPWGGVPGKWEKSNTTLQPFSFDTRDKMKMQRKQQMIQKVIEDEKKLAEFHAQPMPVFEEGIRGVPEKKPPTPTRLRPFNLRSDQRGEVKREQIQKTLEEEERLDRERRTFHAQSDHVVHKQPFVPEKSKKALTDISGFTLNTEIRSEARSEYELHQKQKEDELLAAKIEREKRLAAEEAEEIARMRREAVHKANPVRNFKPVVIKPAPIPPTCPISPDFATNARLRSRKGNASANSTMNLSSATFTTE